MNCPTWQKRYFHRSRWTRSTSRFSRHPTLASIRAALKNSTSWILLQQAVLFEIVPVHILQASILSHRFKFHIISSIRKCILRKCSGFINLFPYLLTKDICIFRLHLEGLQYCITSLESRTMSKTQRPFSSPLLIAFSALSSQYYKTYLWRIICTVTACLASSECSDIYTSRFVKHYEHHRRALLYANHQCFVYFYFSDYSATALLSSLSITLHPRPLQHRLFSILLSSSLRFKQRNKSYLT